MLCYRRQGTHIIREVLTDGADLPDDVLWIDLLAPTRMQKEIAGKFLGIEIPTREEMREIELSNRLYEDRGALFMTMTMLSKVDTGVPETHAVTFIICGERLVTVRYVDTTSFQRFGARVLKLSGKAVSATLLPMLFDAIVNRVADVLERLDHDIDTLSKEIFHGPVSAGTADIDYQDVLGRIGRCGDLSSKIHECLVTLGRVVSFAVNHRQAVPECNEVELLSVRKDIDGLSEHGNYLTSKVNFLLDATLGMISIEQNSVFRLLSVLSLILMPPTLVAGVYGMNFKLMPELDWHWGYPIALLLMLVTAILPYAYLKQRKVL